MNKSNNQDLKKEIKSILKYIESDNLNLADDKCSSLLKIFPDNPRVLFYFGVVKHMSNEIDEAILLIKKSIDISPKSSKYYLKLADIYVDSNAIRHAIDTLAEAMHQLPNNFFIALKFAEIFKSLGDHTNAEKLFYKALSLKPNDYGLLNKFGAHFLQVNNLEKAHSFFQKSIAQNDAFVDTYNNMGVCYLNKNDTNIAKSYFKKALELDNKYVIAYYNLGNIYIFEKNFKKAITQYKKALSLDPENAQAHFNIGVALSETGNTKEAIKHFKTAIQVNPEYIEAYTSLSIALSNIQEHKESYEYISKVYEMDPDNASTLIQLGNTLVQLGEIKEAKKHMLKAYKITDDVSIKIRMATLLPIIMDSNKSIDRERKKIIGKFKEILDENISHYDTHKIKNYTNFFIAYHGRNDREIQELFSKIIIKHVLANQLSANEYHIEQRMVKNKKIRIGIASAFLWNHTIGKLICGIIEKLSANKFEIILLRTTNNKDDIANRINNRANDIVYLPLTYPECIKVILKQKLDILFYPDIGMTPYYYYLSYFRLAPIQCTSWGHPVTSGIPTIDYFISSDLIEPDNAEPHYTEKLVKFRNLPTYYYRPDFDLNIKFDRKAFALPEDKHLYICPQGLFKFHPDFDPVINAILKKDKKALLVLINGHNVYPKMTTLLIDRLENNYNGISNRIQIIPRMNEKDWLRMTTLADCILDPPHFSGGNTSLEMLSLGIPIVTWPGNFMRGRVTYGIFKQMGVMDTVAKDLKSYVDIAIKLANDKKWKKQISDKINKNSHKIFENKDVISEFEKFFIKAVEENYT